MFKLFRRSDPPIREDALRVAAQTACTLFYNSARHFGAYGFIGEQEHIAAEAFLCGAFTHLFNVAGDIDPSRDLDHSTGRRILSTLGEEFVRQNPIFYVKAEGNVETVGGVVDRFVRSIQSDIEAYDLGVQQARLLVLHFNQQAPEPSGSALPELLRSRKRVR